MAFKNASFNPCPDRCVCIPLRTDRNNRSQFIIGFRGYLSLSTTAKQHQRDSEDNETRHSTLAPQNRARHQFPHDFRGAAINTLDTRIRVEA